MKIKGVVVISRPTKKTKLALDLLWAAFAATNLPIARAHTTKNDTYAFGEREQVELAMARA